MQFGVFWKVVFKRHDVSSTADQTTSRRNVCDIGKLRFRNVQEFRKLIAIRSGLVEQDEKFAVCQHQPRCIGSEEFVG